MNVIVFASRKGGSGKSMLAAHLAAHANAQCRPLMLIDADPQGSLTLWHRLRGSAEPALKSGARGVAEVVKTARREGYRWAFIDTPPNMSAIVAEAIRAATLVVIPARLAVFDLAAIKETIELARGARSPYAVVINAAPARRDNTESPFVTESREVISRLNIPVWAGQIIADRAYARAMRILGATPEILNNQGYSYLLRGDYRHARHKLLAAKKLDPDKRDRVRRKIRGRGGNRRAVVGDRPLGQGDPRPLPQRERDAPGSGVAAPPTSSRFSRATNRADYGYALGSGPARRKWRSASPYWLSRKCRLPRFKSSSGSSGCAAAANSAPTAIDPVVSADGGGGPLAEAAWPLEPAPNEATVLFQDSQPVSNHRHAADATNTRATLIRTLFRGAQMPRAGAKRTTRGIRRDRRFTLADVG